MQPSWLIIGLILGYSTALSQPPSPLPNSHLVFPSTSSNETDASAATNGTAWSTDLIDADSPINSSLTVERINSTADTLITDDLFEDNNATDKLIMETTAVSSANASSDQGTTTSNGTVEDELLATKGSIDNDEEGALINTTFELVPTLRRIEANQSRSTGILLPIFHQKLPGAEGTISNVSLLVSPKAVNGFPHNTAAEFNSSSETIEFETNSTLPNNKTANESEVTVHNGLQPPLPELVNRVDAEKSEHDRLSTTTTVHADVRPVAMSTVQSGASPQAVTDDGATRSFEATTAAASRTPEVQFDQQGCGQRPASSLSAAERYSVVSFQFSDLEVPSGEALALLCQYLFGAISHRHRSQVGENDSSASSFFIIADTINDAKQRPWTVSVVLLNATGKAIEGSAASNLLTNYNVDNKLAKIGKVVKISATSKTSTEESTQYTYWQLLDDPLIVTVTSAVIIAICLVLVGSLCALVCWHRYSNRFKGEWIVHGGGSPTESEIWYDNDAFAAGQKYPRTGTIHSTYYGRHRSVDQLAYDMSNGARHRGVDTAAAFATTGLQGAHVGWGERRAARAKAVAAPSFIHKSRAHCGLVGARVAGGKWLGRRRRRQRRRSGSTDPHCMHEYEMARAAINCHGRRNQTS
uniref:Uncharacterized protein n=1 Tax=Plectus sambesii TaxID=2011161 RepID=A0A914W103_9BILA